MNKEAIDGLKAEEEVKMEIDDLKKSIRHLEIELDYEESRRKTNLLYIRKLEKEINDKYEKLDTLYEAN